MPTGSIDLRGLVQVEADVAETVQLLERGDLFEAFQECREEILDSVDENFQRRGSPDGPWPPRADNLPHPLVEESGALRAAATGHGPGHVTVWEDRGFYVGVDVGAAPTAAATNGADLGGVPGAGVHQFGLAPVPARPFMDPAEDALERCETIIADALDRLL